MNCQLFEIVAGDLARDRCVDARTRTRAQEHLKVCPACARYFAELGRLAGALDELAVAAAERKAPQEVEDYLLIRFRQWQALARRHQWPLRRARFWTAAAAAVVVLVAAGGFLLSTGRKGHLVKNATNRFTIAAAQTQTAAAGAAAGVSEPQGWPADFLPLPYGEDTGPMTAAQVVTVTLSAEDLQDIGLPADDLGRRSQVTAEIVIGEDGIARGIRFVQ
ncbi:MAG: anti-sigma factor family protein [Terriglobia bacterium]